jgi:peptidyl-prolyl cis-trans isomerase C
MRALAHALLVLALGAAACGSRASRAQAQHAALGGDTVARVGDIAIPASLVASVAIAQSAEPPRALGFLVDDALAAAGARATGLDQTPEVKRATTASLARLVVLRLRSEARNGGPPSDAEVDEVTKAHWLEVDLPERLRVIHAVVIEPKKPALDAAAGALAQALAATEADATSADDFEARAKALPHEGLELKVERLDPFLADGRIAVPFAGTLDPDFVRGAVPLAPGATTGIVRSKFGWHVIRMIERLPEHRVPFEERRTLFAEEVEATRARRAFERLVGQLAKDRGVGFANGVDEMTTDATMTLLGMAQGAPASAPSP